MKYYIKDPDTKKRKEKREYFGSGPDAGRNADRRNSELKAAGGIAEYNQQPKYCAPLFADLAAAYLQNKANEWLKRDVDNAYYKLTGVILPALGKIPANQITFYRIDQYVTMRMKKVKRSTIRRELTVIIAILNFAVSRGTIPANPLTGYKKPTSDDAIIRPPDIDEVTAIIKNASEHCRRALLINYYTGVRPGPSELFRMTWHDVSFSDQTIVVTSARKGGAVRRTVPVHPALFEYMKKWYEADKTNTHSFIIYYNNKPVRSLKSSFPTAKRKAGITRRLRLYDLRHAAITQMILNGDLKAASEIAGHRDITMTIRQYEHITSKIKKDTVGGIEQVDWE